MVPLRVALFTDTFEEINGVALTSRQFVDFARRHDYPLFCVRGRSATRRGSQAREPPDAAPGVGRTTRSSGSGGVACEHSLEGSVNHCELTRSRFVIHLDRGLLYDTVLWRSAIEIAKAVESFKPDIVHVVSPGDVSTVGVYVAKKLGIPLAISWHTNLHEFGAMRLMSTLRWLPDRIRNGLGQFTEAQSLRICLAFYGMGDVLYAPNAELVAMLRDGTGKPVFPMKRGIDTHLFDPAKRTLNDGVLRIGYVGRTTPEKSVRFLRDLGTALQAGGAPPFRFLIVGDGSELQWLRDNLQNADFRGVRRGADLSEDFANMDVFAFPSRTDTFGNVVLEALASGVPAVVTGAGGPKFIVREGLSGFVAYTDEEFVERVALLLRDTDVRAAMGRAAREQACGESWDEVFRQVYDGYRTALPHIPSHGLHAIKTFDS
jgi:glycosyltransferase involved in cell wall biosynthesis